MTFKTSQQRIYEKFCDVIQIRREEWINESGSSAESLRFADARRAAIDTGNEDDSPQDQSDFKYEATIRRISALGWSTNLRHLPEMNFLQLYDSHVVSTRKYRHIVLKRTHYKKLKSYQFFFEGNVKKLESKVFENKAYVRATVLSSMKKTPYRVVVEFAPTCDVLRAACTCPLVLACKGKENVTTTGEYSLPLKSLPEESCRKISSP